jgi:large subunit ribosomal protein L28
MSRICDLTGKRPNVAHKVSHSNIKTKRWQFPNLQERRLFVPELNRHVRITLSTRDLRTVDRIGLVAYAARYGLDVSKL